MSTRVLYLYSTLTVGGAERQLALLAPALRERGFDPVVATLRHRGRYFDQLSAEGTPTVFVGMRTRKDLRGAARAFRLWKLRPDIVLSSGLDAQVFGQAVAARAGARHVTVEHGGAGLPRSPHRRALARMVAPRVDRAGAVSSSQTPELLALGYTPERITVIPNGIPAPVPRRDRRSVRSELGLSDDDVVAVFAARLRPEKRVTWFLEALARARRRRPELRAVVAGAGPELDRAAAFADAHPDAVRVLGEREDVADLIGAADLVCLTSSFEALPLVVLEAMALGAPVLATNVGGLGDLVVPGVTGWLVAEGDLDGYADALAAAGGNGEAAAMGRAARAVYEERFTLEGMIDRYAELLGGLSTR